MRVRKFKEDVGRLARHVAHRVSRKHATLLCRPCLDLKGLVLKFKWSLVGMKCKLTLSAPCRLGELAEKLSGSVERKALAEPIHTSVPPMSTRPWLPLHLLSPPSANSGSNLGLANNRTDSLAAVVEVCLPVRCLLVTNKARKTSPVSSKHSKPGVLEGL